MTHSTSMTQNASTRFEHLPEHNHQMVLYGSRDEQFDSVIPFLYEGIEAGEKCLFAIDDTPKDEIITGLEQRGVDVETALESGQLTFQNTEEIYLEDGAFDPERMIDCLEEKITEAVDAGYTGLRTTAEMTWAVNCDVDPDRIKTYERKVEELFPKDSFVGQCQYRRADFSEEFLSDMLQHHPRITYDGNVCSNCYYRPPQELDNESNSNAVNRKLETLTAQQDLSESLDHREQCLSLLGQLTEQVREADPDEVEEIAGDLIAQIVEPSLITFARYDNGTGQLETQILVDTLPVSASTVTEDLNGRVWDAFVENDLQEFTLDTDPQTMGIILPIGEHGVFLVATPRTNVMTETDLHFLQAVTGHTEAALDQMTYEQQLERKHEELSEKRDHLERLNRINTVIREITQSLVEATTADEVIETVCELLVRKTTVDFAWYGDYDPATETLHPEHDSGTDQGYLDAVTLHDDWGKTEPSGQTARTQETTTVQNIYDAPPLAHWQEQALKRDFQSMISLPVSYDNSMYGVLSLYSSTPDRFDKEIVAVLDELSDCVAYALNSIDRKQALVTEEVIELEIRVTDTDLPIVGLVNEYECRVTIDDVMSAETPGFRVFTTFHNVDPEAIQTFAVESPKIDALELLSEGDQVHTAKCKVTEQCVIAKLLDHNAVPQSVHAENGEAYLVIHLPRGQQVRSFIEMFQSLYPETEIVARHNRNEPLRHVTSVASQLKDELTDRQLDILKLAFRSGYFERPRDRTAEELADELDVSHPTVSRHLREAERRVFSLLFDDMER